MPPPKESRSISVARAAPPGRQAASTAASELAPQPPDAPTTARTGLCCRTEAGSRGRLASSDEAGSRYGLESVA